MKKIISNQASDLFLTLYKAAPTAEPSTKATPTVVDELPKPSA